MPDIPAEVRAQAEQLAWIADDDARVEAIAAALLAAERRGAQQAIDNGNTFIFCDFVAGHNGGYFGCIRGAGHNGAHCIAPDGTLPYGPVLAVQEDSLASSSAGQPAEQERK